MWIQPPPISWWCHHGDISVHCCVMWELLPTRHHVCLSTQHEARLIKSQVPSQCFLETKLDTPSEPQWAPVSPSELHKSWWLASLGVLPLPLTATDNLSHGCRNIAAPPTSVSSLLRSDCKHVNIVLPSPPPPRSHSVSGWEVWTVPAKYKDTSSACYLSKLA